MIFSHHIPSTIYKLSFHLFYLYFIQYLLLPWNNFYFLMWKIFVKIMFNILTITPASTSPQVLFNQFHYWWPMFHINFITELKLYPPLISSTWFQSIWIMFCLVISYLVSNIVFNYCQICYLQFLYYIVSFFTNGNWQKHFRYIIILGFREPELTRVVRVSGFNLNSLLAIIYKKVCHKILKEFTNLDCFFKKNWRMLVSGP